MKYLILLFFTYTNLSIAHNSVSIQQKHYCDKLALRYNIDFSVKSKKGWFRYIEKEKPENVEQFKGCVELYYNSEDFRIGGKL